MALGTIASKTYGIALEDRNLVLEPGVAYQRLTSLSDTWKRARIGAVISFTNTAELNGVPVQESVEHSLSNYLQSFIGFSNGLGMPGASGVRFVGESSNLGTRYTVLSKSGDIYSYGHADSNDTGIIRNYYFSARVINSAASVAGNNISAVASFGPPTQPTAFAVGLMVDVEAKYSTSASLTVGVAVLANVTHPNLAVNQVLGSTPNNYATTPAGVCWWNNTTTFTGCKHLFIRWPFLNNRLRIHALKVMQLA